MTRTNVTQILALLHTAFPNTRIDAEATINLWYSLYADEDFEVAKKATEHIIRTNRFFPTHYDFGEALRRVKYLDAIIKNTPPAITAHSDSNSDDILTDIAGMLGE